jgi:hypothetical protein
MIKSEMKKKKGQVEQKQNKLATTQIPNIISL